MKIVLFGISTVGCFVLILVIVGSAQAITYSIIDLGTLGGTSYGTGINNAGQVVGHSVVGPVDQHAFLWGSGTITDLGTLGGTSSYAYAINNFGQMVGDSQLGDGSSTGNKATHATLWNGGIPTDLTIEATDYTYATAINNVGQVVGNSYLLSNYYHATFWNGSTAYDLGTLPGGNYSRANGINDAGQIVGYSEASFASFTTNRATLWSGGTITDLGTLSGKASLATGINNAGQVVGYSSLRPSGSPTDDGQHATLWNSSDGSITDLGTLGGKFSTALAINNVGQVVGNSSLAGQDNESHHATLWNNGTPLDLNTLLDSSGAGWLLYEATAINDKGWIVGTAVSNQGKIHGFLLTPNIPEPSTCFLLGLGTLSLLWSIRKR